MGPDGETVSAMADLAGRHAGSTTGAGLGIVLVVLVICAAIWFGSDKKGKK